MIAGFLRFGATAPEACKLTAAENRKAAFNGAVCAYLPDFATPIAVKATFGVVFHC